MTPTFLLQIDTGDDTDLFAIADEIAQLVDGQEGFTVLSCKPWSHPTLTPSQTPPDVSGQQ